MLFASDLIEHDGELRDLPLIDRKQRLAEPVGKAREPSGRTNCISQKLESAQYAWRFQRETAQNSVIDGCAPRC